MNVTVRHGSITGDGDCGSGPPVPSPTRDHGPPFSAAFVPKRSLDPAAHLQPQVRHAITRSQRNVTAAKWKSARTAPGERSCRRGAGALTGLRMRSEVLPSRRDDAGAAAVGSSEGPRSSARRQSERQGRLRSDPSVHQLQVVSEQTSELMNNGLPGRETLVPRARHFAPDDSAEGQRRINAPQPIRIGTITVTKRRDPGQSSFRERHRLKVRNVSFGHVFPHVGSGEGRRRRTGPTRGRWGLQILFATDAISPGCFSGSRTSSAVYMKGDEDIAVVPEPVSCGAGGRGPRAARGPRRSVPSGLQPFAASFHARHAVRYRGIAGRAG
ncbi:hypothetical protein Z043_121947 [Scleropages formosus]|uniref:Uncharacterized protein n=1 Tax=Scleropages formosus TaxID=113540 RepID=A0A0P7UKX0_SCLFO|nr:hypothetical protein Z043_121947 [Scleropages formosus]